MYLQTPSEYSKRTLSWFVMGVQIHCQGLGEQGRLNRTGQKEGNGGQQMTGMFCH
jgi:hypothetical protein